MEPTERQFADVYDFAWSNTGPAVASFVAYDKRTGHKYTQFRFYKPNPETRKHNDPGIPRRMVTARGDNVQATASYIWGIWYQQGQYPNHTPLVRYGRS